MLKIYEYTNGSIKIMFDEKYSGIEVNTETYIQRIELENFVSPLLPTSLSLEVAVHRGGRICYGLISTTIKPGSDTNSILLSVQYTKANTEKFTDSILQTDTYVYKGLPKGYLESIVSGAINELKKREVFPSCDLYFDYAANCEVGSSPMFFRMLSESVIELIKGLAHKEISASTLDMYEEHLAGKFGMRH